MTALQKCCIFLVAPLVPVMAKIPLRIRNAVVFLCFFLMISIGLIRRSNETIGWGFSFRETEWAIICSVLLLIAVVFSMNGALAVRKVRPVYAVFFFLSPLLIVISGFDHYIGQGIRPFAIVLIVLFPLFYFVWANRADYHLLYQLLALAMVVAGLAFFILCLWVAPPTMAGRYAGVTPNPNTIGTIAATVFFCSAWLIFEGKLPSRLLAVIAIPLSLSLMLLSDSRTAFFVVFVTTILGIVRLIQIFRENKRRGRLILFCILIVFIILFVGAFSFIQYQNTKNTAPDAALNFMRIKATIDYFIGNADQSYTVDVLLSGRADAWQAYAEHINMRGNNVRKVFVSDPSGSGKRLAAHNNVIEITYRSGLPAGIAYAGLLIVSVFFAFRLFRAREEKGYALFVCFAVTGYIVTIMFESMITMTLYPVVILFYLSLGPLFFKAYYPDTASSYPHSR